MSRRVASGIVVAAVLLGATFGAGPHAAAAVGTLTAGQPIQIGRTLCTLGFFGLNERSDRLAVTAGHCSQRPGQTVYAGSTPIGRVVARRDDRRLPGGGCCIRGYTLIRLTRTVTVNPFFYTGGTAAIGDRVRKFGRRTQVTSGSLIGARTDDAPERNILKARLLQQEGDSGAPWYSSGRVLIGMASSGNEQEGEDAAAYAQPLRDVLTMIRRGAGRWGPRFPVVD